MFGFVDEFSEEEMKQLQAFKLITSFNLIGKIKRFYEKPDGIIKANKNTISFYSTEKDGEKVIESYDIQELWGSSVFQCRTNAKKTWISLRSFPEGYANFNRNVIMVANKGEDGYLVTTMVADNQNLGTLENMRQRKVQSFDYATAMACLLEFKDDIDRKSLEIFIDYLGVLSPDFAFPTAKIDEHNQVLQHLITSYSKTE